ncbi:transporter [Solilutibacter silvestris]|uniref:MetA-pathway of phenol degradation n=1 Tax=Solilutibacter silvestris TaxID=1645665 RepID=A0A2K1Q3F0_9GAMM|nr:transporter [Lysobacter silvestris]PNS09576.1 hypothetical protein Lysil_1205 [Lysobacter silvestris]
MIAAHHATTRPRRPYIITTLTAALIVCLPDIAHACATCGCTLSTDAATGYSAESGWRISFDNSFIDQNQLRHGTHGATPGQVVDHPSDPTSTGSEIERNTINRYHTASIAWRPNANWGVSLAVPWIQRDHTTYGQQEQPFTPAAVAPDQISSARVNSLGDVKVLVNYQGWLPTHNLGIVAGIKLPTGKYGGQTEDGTIVGHPVLFRSGHAAGQTLDTSLQAGTGTTDAIVGAYYYQPVSQDYDVFVNGQFQAAVSQRMSRSGADFRPGNQGSLNLGLRYEARANFVPQLQLNLLHKDRDRGAFADIANSAGTVAYLSPGASATVFGTQVYAFVQLPVYSRLEGYQLFPHWTASIGISKAF